MSQSLESLHTARSAKNNTSQHWDTKKSCKGLLTEHAKTELRWEIAEADSCLGHDRFNKFDWEPVNMTPDRVFSSQGNKFSQSSQPHSVTSVSVCVFLLNPSRHSWMPANAWKNTVMPTGCVHSLWKRFPGSLHPRCPCLRHMCRSPENNLCLWRTSLLP